ncbi:MAG: serine/threonine protein kinase [Alphaproteobacteria bacterium]|nr:serine/threonine protein kinase [Alphaproteobacteria bacterium]
MARRLGLSAEQQEKVHTIISEADGSSGEAGSGGTLQELPENSVDPLSSTDEQPDSLPVATGGGPLGRYKEVGVLGKGGMGEVLRVVDPTLKRAIAMKVISAKLADREDLVSRFTEEAQATAQLQHPGIITVHELGRLADGRVYFTMQEIKGRTLRKAISNFHRRPLEERQKLGADAERDEVSLWRLLEAFRKVCDAVGYAHSRGVLHRDLKPSNVMMGEFGAVYVLDWGIVKVLKQKDDSIEDAVQTSRSTEGAHLTRKGQVLGTPKYMAPEQADGEIDQHSPPTDVYALGVILFEIFMGRRPDWGVLDQALRLDIMPSPDSPEPILPLDMKQIIRKALAFDIELRYPEAGALGEAVEKWMIGARSAEG